MGINKLNHSRLTQLYTAANCTLSIEEAANILQMPRKEVAKLMARWVEQGWFLRIKRGLYISIKPDVTGLSLNNSWAIVKKIYNPCYIGGLSAAEYWGFINQKISSINVFSTQKLRNRKSIVDGINVTVRTVSPQTMFGLVSLISQQADILVSDPSRTMIDFLISPKLGGGIYNVIDMFNKYLKSEHRNAELLLSYARKILNGAVLKRLGYLLERCKAEEFNSIRLCYMLKTTGQIKLDPGMSADRLVTRWGLWISNELAAS